MQNLFNKMALELISEGIQEFSEALTPNPISDSAHSA